MNSATNHTHTDAIDRDLRLPDHRQEVQTARGPLRLFGALAGAAGVGIVALIYLIGAPIVAFITGVGQIAMEIRDNAVRPRPFVGARHGLPFLDPPVPAPATATDTDETED
jgi:hypothetical protein